MAYATVKIEGNKIISTSLWNTHTFEIVEKIPGNYLVWNIGENMGTDLYIPICQMLHPGDKEDFSMLKHFRCSIYLSGQFQIL